jgi:hypothetical protein
VLVASHPICYDVALHFYTLLETSTIICGLLVGIVLFFFLSDHAFWERMFTMSKITLKERGARRVNFWIIGWEVAKRKPVWLGNMGFFTNKPLSTTTRNACRKSRHEGSPLNLYEYSCRVRFSWFFLLYGLPNLNLSTHKNAWIMPHPKLS